MTKIQIVGFALYEALTIVLALIGAPIVAAFVKWDSEPSVITGGAPLHAYPAIRGDLPGWAWMWATIDERMPCAMYEQTMRETLARVGPYWTTVRWLIRNRMMGLTKALFGRACTADDTVLYTKKIVGPFAFGAGWKRYRATPTARPDTGPFVAMPSVSVRLARNA
jgi:hypothetical protein